MYLLDTNVVSDLRKAKAGKADPNLTAWARQANPELQFICAITVYEIEIGILRSEWRDPAQGVVLRRWLQDEVLPLFEGRIFAVDDEIAQLAARFQVPDPAPLQDMLIAATALVHGMTVVTRNVSDFVRTGVRLLNPWEFQAP